MLECTVNIITSVKCLQSAASLSTMKITLNNVTPVHLYNSLMISQKIKSKYVLFLCLQTDIQKTTKTESHKNKLP